MNDPTVPQTVLFPDLFDRPLVATFDQAHASSDGGAVLLKAADRALGLTAALAQALRDPRAATRVTHAWSGVLAQRVFGIACGYPDANDADGLAANQQRESSTRLGAIGTDNGVEGRDALIGVLAGLLWFR